MTKPSKEHENALTKIIIRLESEGHRVVRMSRKLPDAISTKDGKIYAVEVCGKVHRGNGKGWKNKYSLNEKRIAYKKFDGLIYEEFYYAKKN